MSKLQFRILYREFLFRMVDLELLSSHAQGDITRLLGQFASLLIFVSLILSLGPATWSFEHLLIATTMLVVGLFAVASWDSTFPDRRDVLVLAPLPVRGRTLFLAKVAALGTALGLTVAAINAATGLVFPFSAGGIRAFPAFWITMLAAGAFIFCCVLCVQGLAAQVLPRRAFVRVSAFLQMAAFCLFLTVYFLQPSLATPRDLTAAANQRALALLPSYWFLGLFHKLNGSMHPALAPLAKRACIGLATAVFGAGGAFLVSYLRTLRKIVEQPDIEPGARGLALPLRFGNSLETALVLFSARSLLRSRQHRVMLAFYLGIGFALVILFTKPTLRHQQFLPHQANVPLLVSSALMMCAWVVGTRVVFSMPLAIRANWIFRITQVSPPVKYPSAIRRPLFLLAVAPLWMASAVVFFVLWPWQPAAAHLIALWLFGTIIAYLCLHGFHKIPFTCSYLPGKSYFHMAFLGALGMIMLTMGGAVWELGALRDPVKSAEMLLALGAAVAVAAWRTIASAKASEVQFEEVPDDAVTTLGLRS